MLFRIIFFAGISLFLSLPLSMAEDFEILGVEFPAIEAEGWIVDRAILPHSQFPDKSNLLFYLSTSGTVDSLHYTPEKKKTYIDGVINSLKQIRFYPASINDSIVPFILPAELIFVTRRDGPDAYLRFPFEEEACIKRKGMLEKTLELNRFILPSIERFPSYFCYFGDEPEIDNYNYTIFEIDLDEDGKLVDFREIYNGHKAYTRMISKVLLYADFKPAEYRGLPFASTIYMIVRFFDFFDYPTGIWPPQKGSEGRMPFDYLRLETGFYLDSIINPPIPINCPFGKCRLSESAPFNDTIEVFVKIDTLGNITKFNNHDFVFAPLKPIISKVMEKIKFTSARNMSNEKVSFEGLLYLIFDSSKIIRIVVQWMPVEAQTAPE